jgi:sugar lactone lactonase YvrE
MTLPGAASSASSTFNWIDGLVSEKGHSQQFERTRSAMNIHASQIPKAELAEARTVASGLGFAEAPRWHEGALWFSDIANSKVCKLGADGTVDVVCSVPGNAAGLGWLPDGRLLVVSMHERVVYRFGEDGLHVHADLRSIVPADLNDMVVSADGTAYVGNMGYDAKTEPIATTGMVKIYPDGSAEMQPGDLLRPNGCAISPDGKTLVVAETRIGRVSSQPIDPQGRLGTRFDIAVLPEGSWADGLCLDSEGAVWVCDPAGYRVIRVGADGEIRRILHFGKEQPLGCTLGGEGRRTLFVTLAPLPFGRKWEDVARDQLSSIVALDVHAPGAGWP